jgi:hypothetical protein
MTKIAELKLSSCGLEVADFRKIYDCGIAELRLRSNISFKSCGIAIAEALPSSCGIAIADSKKSCACPPLIITYRRILSRISNIFCVFDLFTRSYLRCLEDGEKLPKFCRYMLGTVPRWTWELDPLDSPKVFETRLEISKRVSIMFDWLCDDKESARRNHQPF